MTTQRQMISKKMHLVNRKRTANGKELADVSFDELFEQRDLLDNSNSGLEKAITY